MKRVVVLAALAACGKSGGAAVTTASGSDVFVDPAASADDLLEAALANPSWNDSADLKLDVPAGWTSSYDLKSWSLTKTRRTPDESDRGAFSIEIASPRTPRTADALLAARLRVRDAGVTLPITRTERLDGGVLVEFDEKIPHDDEPRFEFIAVRRLGDRILKCDSLFFLDSADRAAAEKICLGAHRERR